MYRGAFEPVRPFITAVFVVVYVDVNEPQVLDLLGVALELLGILGDLTVGPEAGVDAIVALKSVGVRVVPCVVRRPLRGIMDVDEPLDGNARLTESVGEPFTLDLGIRELIIVGFGPVGLGAHRSYTPENTGCGFVAGRSYWPARIALSTSSSSLLRSQPRHTRRSPRRTCDIPHSQRPQYNFALSPRGWERRSSRR